MFICVQLWCSTDAVEDSYADRNMFVICIRIKDDPFANKSYSSPHPIPSIPSSCSTDDSNAVLLLQLFIVRALVVSYVAFGLSLFIPHHAFFCAIGRLCFMILAFPGYLHLHLACHVWYFITKTYHYNFVPLKPHFYIVKTGVYRGIHYFSYFDQKHRL